jgi:hypothetical protein
MPQKHPHDLSCEDCGKPYTSPTGRYPTPPWHVLATRCPDCVRSGTAPKAPKRPKKSRAKSKHKAAKRSNPE